MGTGETASFLFRAVARCDKSSASFPRTFLIDRDPCTYIRPKMPTKFSWLATLTLLVAFHSLQAQRQDVELSTGWKFIQQDADLAAPADTWTDVLVPHTWNALDGQKGVAGNPGVKGGYYRGTCWYARGLDIPADWQGRRVFVRFEAASIVAKTYLNGELLGEHRGAFTAFCYELTPHLRFGGKNELRVQVDNSPQADVPPISGDFNMDGGLYRPAHLIVTDAVCISPLDFASPGVYVSTKSATEVAAEVEVKTVLSDGAKTPEDVRVETVIADAAGQPVASAVQPTRLNAGEPSTVTTVRSIPHPHRWNGRRDPYLYSVRVRLYRNQVLADEVMQPLGIRTVEISQEKGFLLNGQSYPIFGVCRHQDRRDQGWALTPANHEEDARLILEIGATAVRNTHYPQSQCWHDLADRNGLLMWDEVSNVDTINDTPEYTAGARRELTGMVHQLYNHPSIAFWGLFNEIGNKKTPGPVPLLTQLKEDIKALDSSRIIVAATDHNNQAYNHIPEALCLNTYPGWYGGKPEQMGGHIDQTFKEFGDRRIAMSEYGAGANPAQHMEGTPKIEKASAPFHPEEYQDVVHEVDYAAMKDNPKLWGSFLWVMFDFPAAPRQEGGTTGLNDKGMVTQDRQVRKDAFYFYKANWSEQPTVYIAARRLTPRQQATTEVKVYSNCAEVELSVNGKALGKAEKDRVNVFRWEDVALQPGANRIEATARANGKAVADQCEWTVENAPATPSPTP